MYKYLNQLELELETLDKIIDRKHQDIEIYTTRRKQVVKDIAKIKSSEENSDGKAK